MYQLREVRYSKTIRILWWILSPVPWLGSFILFSWVLSPDVAVRPQIDPLRFWPSFLAALWIATALHEAGHMAAALFLGWPVRAITVWPITIVCGEHGCCWRWDFRQGPGGDVDVLYPKHRSSAAAYVWLYGAGPLTNALLMAVGLGAIRIAATHPTRTLARMLVVLTNFIVGSYALWPRGTRPFTDGDMLLAALAYWQRDRRTAPIDPMDTGALPSRLRQFPNHSGQELRTAAIESADRSLEGWDGESFAGWRKLVGVEPTRDSECRTLVLKTRPSTGQE